MSLRDLYNATVDIMTDTGEDAGDGTATVVWTEKNAETLSGIGARVRPLAARAIIRNEKGEILGDHKIWLDAAYYDQIDQKTDAVRWTGKILRIHQCLPAQGRDAIDHTQIVAIALPEDNQAA